MKIIFLDIDGVLNNQVWYMSDKFREGSTKEEYEVSQFDPRCVRLLNNLTDTTGAKIVVSSSWRLGRTVDELSELFEKVGITGQVIDKTPLLRFTGLENYYYSVPRGCEIKAWIEMNKGIIGDKVSRLKYVILDDDSDMLYWQRDKYIWVDPYNGLTPNIIYKANKLLL